MANITLQGNVSVTLPIEFTFDSSQLPTTTTPVTPNPPVVTPNPPIVTNPVNSTTLVDGGIPSNYIPLMTKDWAFNQVATQYPVEARQLKWNNGDGQFIDRPIVDNFKATWGSFHINFSMTSPRNIVDSSKVPTLFTNVTITEDWGSDDEVDTTDANGNIIRTVSNIPINGEDIEFPQDIGGDHHMLVFDIATGLLHELYGVVYSGTTYSADFYRRWDVTKPQVGALDQNSADAAGLPMLPLILDYDEAMTGSINHALRVTVNHSRLGPTGSAYCLPACHGAADNWGSPSYMGQRMYLRADFPETGLSAMNLTLVHCMKTYGLVVADNGLTGVIVGTLDSRWDNDDLTILQSNITMGDFTIVDSGPIYHADGATLP